jgi:hypothetical protein
MTTEKMMKVIVWRKEKQIIIKQINNDFLKCK